MNKRPASHENCLVQDIIYYTFLHNNDEIELHNLKQNIQKQNLHNEVFFVKMLFL